MVGQKDDVPVEARVTGKDFQAIGFSLVGLFVLVQAVPDLTGEILSFLMIEENEMMNQAAINHRMVRAGVFMIQLIIGVGLLLGANSLAGLLKKLQKAGVRS